MCIRLINPKNKSWLCILFGFILYTNCIFGASGWVHRVRRVFPKNCFHFVITFEENHSQLWIGRPANKYYWTWGEFSVFRAKPLLCQWEFLQIKQQWTPVCKVTANKTLVWKHLVRIRKFQMIRNLVINIIKSERKSLRKL